MGSNPTEVRALILAFFLLSTVACLGQSHAVHLNANYLISQKPVFGFGYAYAADSSHFSFGTSFEFGRFESIETGILANAVDRYEESGIGFRPEARYYFATNQRGFFVAGFANFRAYYANHMEGRVNDQSGALEFPLVASTMGKQWRLGAQAGYRMQVGASGMLLECALGAGTQAFNPSKTPAFVQIDLNLLGFFQTALRSEEEADYFTPAD